MRNSSARIDGADHGYAEPAHRACEEWTAYAGDVTQLVNSYEHDEGELRKLPKLPTDVTREAAAADAVVTRYGSFEATKFVTRDVERARDRLAEVRGPWARPHDHELLGQRHGVFFAGCDPRVLKYPTGFLLGAAWVVDRGVVAHPRGPRPAPAAGRTAYGAALLRG